MPGGITDWTTLSLGHIIKGTWSFGLGTGRKADETFCTKNYCCEIENSVNLYGDSVHTNAETVFRICHGSFLLNSFQVTAHISSYHLTLYSLDTVSIVK